LLVKDPIQELLTPMANNTRDDDNFQLPLNLKFD